MKLIFILLSIIAFTNFSKAIEKKSEYKWVSAKDLSLILPINTKLHIKDSKENESLNSFGLSFMGIGNETVSKTGGFRIEAFKVDNNLTGKNTFYLFEFLFGVKYLSQKSDKSIKPVLSVLGNLGMSSSRDFFIMPELNVGFLYSKDFLAETPKGFIFEVFYKPFQTYISDAGNNKSGDLKPFVGIKLGYVFEGFWQKQP